MAEKVAVAGIGLIPASSVSPALSYKEIMFEAATRAYDDAGISASDIDGAVCCSEDFTEGTSIFDEYVPDQLGVARKPVHTISADGLFGVATACMKILSGLMDVVIVEAHSKASNIRDKEEVQLLGYDPVWLRHLGLSPFFLAGLEMTRFMEEEKISRKACAEVSAKNKRQALKNPYSAYGAKVNSDDVLASEIIASPLTEMEIAHPADGAAVVVLVSEKKAKKLKLKRPVWVRGIGWSTEGQDFATRASAKALYAAQAGARAYKMAGVKNPAKSIHIAEVDDSFSYKEIQHRKALKLSNRTAVNPSGGSLGIGHLGEASGLYRFAEVVMQLRGEAGARQVPKAKMGLAQAWRGLPTATGAVAILSS